MFWDSGWHVIYSEMIQQPVQSKTPYIVLLSESVSLIRLSIRVQHLSWMTWSKNYLRSCICNSPIFTYPAPFTIPIHPPHPDSFTSAGNLLPSIQSTWLTVSSSSSLRKVIIPCVVICHNQIHSLWKRQFLILTAVEPVDFRWIGTGGWVTG